MNNELKKTKELKKKISKNKLLIYCGLVIISIIIISISILFFIPTKSNNIKKLTKLKKTSSIYEVLDKLDKMYGEEPSGEKAAEKKEVFNIVFKEEIAAEKKRVEAIEEAKRQEEINKSKIYISDVKQVDSSYIPKIQFTLNNPTNMTISYIKFDIKLYDSNNNLVDTDWTNETNISPNSIRVIDTFIPSNDSCTRFTVEISEINFY